MCVCKVLKVRGAEEPGLGQTKGKAQPDKETH